MASGSPCPSHTQLHLVVEQTATDEEFDRLLEHVAQCERCGQAVDTLLDHEETLASLAALPRTPPAVDPAAEQIKQRLRLLARGAGVSRGDTLPPEPVSLDFLAPGQQADELGRLGHYRILKQLGAGGMGLVFLAEDTLLQRKVALKTMLPGVAAAPQAKARFMREAQAAASIEHEHIVAIHQVGEDNGVAFLAMPLLKGESLEARLERDGRLSVPEALCIAAEMAEGLAAAHAAGLVHRDIKPGNVFLEQGGARGERVKLLDFGLARLRASDHRLTQSGVIVGTPSFMAPEQARGETVDGRADLFSLGCVLYRMLTGTRPFPGENALAVLNSLALHDPRAPALVNPAVPAAVSALTMRLLAKNVTDRPASVADVAQQLRTLTERPTILPIKARRYWVTTAVAALLLAGLGALSMLGRPRDNAPSVPEVQTVKTTTPRPADREKPFALWRDGAEAGAFKTFPGLWESRQPGDEIVVHGDGPFPLPHLDVKDQTLVLKAAPGFRPQFVPDASLLDQKPIFWLTIRGGGLRVENCDFLADGRPGGWPSGAFFFARVHDGPCVFRGCRLLGFNDCVFHDYYSPALTMEDCLLECGSGMLLRIVGAGAELTLTNNLIHCGELVGHFQSPGDQKMRLIRNTIAFAGHRVTHVSDDYVGKIPVTAEGNLFDLTGSTLDVPIPKDWLEKRIRWQGKGNCYSGLRQGLAAWNAHLPEPETESSAVPNLSFGWHLDMSPQPDTALTAQRARLEQVRRQTGLDDVGPDLSLVGPGDAYLRGLAAEGRAVPPEQIRPEPLAGGRIAVLRAGTKPVGYPTLEEATARIEDGDTIEIRTDRELLGTTLPPGRGALTLRAAPGYRPVITSTVYIQSGTTLTVEGLTFTNGTPLRVVGEGVSLDQQGRIALLAYCAFDTFEPGRRLVSGPFQARDGSPGEVLRCVLSGLLVPLNERTSVRIRESILTCVEVAVTDSTGGDVAGRIELEGCIVSQPASPWHVRPLTARLDEGQGRCRWEARRCLFEPGIPLLHEVPRTSWFGEKNCYSLAGWLDRGDHSVLARWRAITRSPETGSVTVEPITADPQRWRLPDGNPTARSGPDIDRIVPR